MTETIVETKSCKNCGTKFDITNTDLEFYNKISPTFNREKISIPAPTRCPDCRQQRRLNWRNETKLYKNICDASGKQLISMYRQNNGFKIFDKNIWEQDNWDPLIYGRDYDFNKTFFEQFQTLLKEVPRPHINVNESENSVYQNNAGYNKNCYLVFNAGNDENCYYSSNIDKSQNCIDCTGLFESQLCYECIDCRNCYNLSNSQESSSCKNSSYLYACHNCEFCVGCSNLIGKQYCIFNKQYSKDDFFILKQKLSHEQIKIEFKLIKEQAIRINIIGKNNENVSGNHIYNSKEIKNSYNMTNCENIQNSYSLIDSNNCSDITLYGYNLQYSYECHQAGSNSKNIVFCNSSYEDCNNLLYCDICKFSSNLFGCIGLKHKHYCILNKQYSKEEYEKLVAKIIEHMKSTGEWGEFFPSHLSPFAYNESQANEFYPLNKQKAINSGYQWIEEEQAISIPTDIETIQTKDLPNINDFISNKSSINEILSKAIICSITGRPFRIIKPEIDIYIRLEIELPGKHPDQRHLERLAKRNPKKLRDRNCDKCSIVIKSTYAPERPEVLYCEKCYEKEVY